MHSIRAVSDDDTFDALVDLLTDRDRQFLILLRPHILREHSKKLFRVQVADISQFRNRSIELSGRESRDDRSGAVIQPRSNGSACAEELDLWQPRSKGEFPLWDLVMSFFIAGFLHAENGLDIDTDVVSGDKLDHYMLVIIVLTAGQNDTLKASASGIDGRITPDSRLIVFEDFQSPSFVTFEEIKHCSPPSRIHVQLLHAVPAGECSP